MRKKLNETPQSVNQSLYTNVDFKDGVVGNSYPSRDKINPSLLLDIETAAKKVGVTASITTAVSGHDSGTRHETGNAVDIAIFNGQGFSSKDDAVKKGIYTGIYNFIQELISMGYIYNSESGNDKAVLSFGFKGHDNHVHVSRNSDGGDNSVVTKSPDDKTTTDTATTTPASTPASTTTEYGDLSYLDPLIDKLPLKALAKSFVNTGVDAESTESKKINEQITRIKLIMNL
jgi:hypothetical protein